MVACVLISSSMHCCTSISIWRANACLQAVVLSVDAAALPMGHHCLLMFVAVGLPALAVKRPL